MCGAGAPPLVDAGAPPLARARDHVTAAHALTLAPPLDHAEAAVAAADLALPPAHVTLAAPAALGLGPARTLTLTPTPVALAHTHAHARLR